MQALVVAAVLTVLVSSQAPQASHPSDRDVEAAIKDGLAGRKLEASCRTPVGPQGAYFEVIAEGPLGRIMRAAREAAGRGEPFDADRVMATHTAPHVTISVTSRVTEPSDPGPTRAFQGEIAPPPMPTILRTPPRVLRVTFVGTALASRQPRNQVPLNTFLELSDPVEIRVNSTAGEASCWLRPAAVARPTP